jgi:DNA-binding CsgD family transcriptional regulator
VTALLGPSGRDGIQAASDAGVLTIDGDRLRFTHPLLATAAYSQLDRDGKRDLHARIAPLVDDVEDRARHLALAAEGADADVAHALDLAARRARARGAPDAAAELWDAAARLSPEPDAETARIRRFEAARCRYQLGDVARARQMFDEILADCPAGSTRARVLIDRGWAIGHLEGYTASARAFRSALAEIRDAGHDWAEIELEDGLAWSLHNSEGVAAAHPHAARAVELAQRSGDPQAIAVAMTLREFTRSLAGRGLAVDAVGQTLVAVELADRPQILRHPEWLHGLLLQWEGRLPEARDRLQALHDETVARGNEQSLPFVLFHLARTQLLLGDWTSARRSAEACARTTIDSGQESERPYAAAIVALVQAHLGDVDRARAEIAAALDLSERFAVRPAAIEMLATRGFIELSLGNYDDAERVLEQVAAATHETGLLEPGLFRYHGDAIEAKVALGRLDEAATLLAATQTQASELDRAWLHLIEARCRALLAAARGDLDSAAQVLIEAIHDDASGQPFEHARTLLVLGSVHRRNRQKRAARDALVAAVDQFDRLGAGRWSERARAELSRVGGRAPTTEALTATERQVAELIAAGRTYREAAAELFISPKTVQWNLSKVYSKLGIRSRAELPGRLLED